MSAANSERSGSSHVSGAADKQGGGHQARGGPTSRPEKDTFGRDAHIFTGPDGLAPHRRPNQDPMFCGIGERSFENTEALGYMFRPPTGQRFPKAKNGNIGETGWEVDTWGLKKGL